jgi:beta-1,4-mannosyl-glycoprotein beta-1,4-N-acetylglucosaminyltransferase
MLVAVYDVFPFFNEIDLLEIRLNTLDPLVDFFVITECTTTFSGKKKRLYFQENKAKFSKFSERIIHQVVDSVPDLDPFSRDRYQRDQARSILEGSCNSGDYIVYGDVDEIPKPTALLRGIEAVKNKGGMAHLAQDLYYFYLNVQEISNTLMSYTGEYRLRLQKKWLGTNISRWEYAQRYNMTDLRNPSHKKNGVRIKDGGWHFTYVGSGEQDPVADRIRRKIISAAHQELNTEEILSRIESNIQNLEDLFGRDRTKFRVLNELDYLPDYVRKNASQYEYLLRK